MIIYRDQLRVGDKFAFLSDLNWVNKVTHLNSYVVYYGTGGWLWRNGPDATKLIMLVSRNNKYDKI